MKVDYTLISPNKSHPRNHSVDRITIHCTVGQMSVERLGAVFANPNRRASSNYGIGPDGRVGMYCGEEDRSWCSSNADNDNRAITIEVASDARHPYAVKDAAYATLLDLCEDICRRYGKKKLLWFGDKQKTLAYRPKEDEMVMTVHRWFANKACVPVDTEVLTREGWKRIDSVSIGEEIASANINDLGISFEPVYDIIEQRTQDTYTNNGLTATKDHRMVYCTHYPGSWKIEDYKHILKDGRLIYIPLAGYARNDDVPISDDMLAFLCAVQADGHYMHETRADGTQLVFGLEFHLKKQRKIDRIKAIIESIGYEYKENRKADGSVSIRIYNQHGVNIVNDVCEKHLQNKCFTLEWMSLSERQAKLFIDEVQFWDGCKAASLYCSTDRINIDVISAVCALNGIGSNISEDGKNISFRRSNPAMTISHEYTKRNARDKVCCVSVKTGLFLCRQNGKTFIIGNCPGEYLMSKHPEIARIVTERLDDEVVTDRQLYNKQTGEVITVKGILKDGQNYIRLADLADMGVLDVSYNAEENLAEVGAKCPL